MTRPETPTLADLLHLAFGWPGTCPSLARLLDRWEAAQ